MTKREMMSLLIKIAGIYALVYFVPGLVQSIGITVMQFRDINEHLLQYLFIMFLTVILYPAFWIALCLAIIFKSDWFARRLYQEDGPAGQLMTLGFRDLQLLGFHFIGLMVLVRAIPYAVGLVCQTMRYSESHRPDIFLMSLISPVLQIVIGLVLFLYPHGLANLWAMIQGKQLPKYGEE